VVRVMSLGSSGLASGRGGVVISDDCWGTSLLVGVIVRYVGRVWRRVVGGMLVAVHACDTTGDTSDAFQCFRLYFC
jgi:hypothetical protein